MFRVSPCENTAGKSVEGSQRHRLPRCSESRRETFRLWQSPAASRFHKWTPGERSGTAWTFSHSSCPKTSLQSLWTKWKCFCIKDRLLHYFLLYFKLTCPLEYFQKTFNYPFVHSTFLFVLFVLAKHPVVAVLCQTPISLTFCSKAFCDLFLAIKAFYSQVTGTNPAVCV